MSRQVKVGETIFLRGMEPITAKDRTYDMRRGPFRVLKKFTVPRDCRGCGDRKEVVRLITILLKEGKIEGVSERTFRVKEWDGECYR